MLCGQDVKGAVMMTKDRDNWRIFVAIALRSLLTLGLILVLLFLTTLW